MATGSEHLTLAMRSLEAAFLIGMDGVCEIWLVRHGDCYQDMADPADPPLSALGREQVDRLAERVRDAAPSAVYSSPYRRALETARSLSDDVHVDERLIEMELEFDVDGTYQFREDPTAVGRRMRSALLDIAQRHAGQRVIVIGHGAAIVACLSDIMQLESGRLRVLPYYTSVSVIRVVGDRMMVGGLVDTAHLT